MALVKRELAEVKMARDILKKATAYFELVHHRRYRTRAQATQEITEYIEIFYSRQLKQARLGYLSPAAFTKQYYEKRLAT